MSEASAVRPSVNALASHQLAALVREAAALRIAIERGPGGAMIIDAGVAVRGGLETGRRIAEICMGGLGSVHFTPGESALGGVTQIHVHSADPVLACLGSQYAGWSLVEEGKGGFQALASGPGRAIARRESLFQELGYADQHDSAVFVLEVDRQPPATIVEKVARDCGLP